MIDGDERIEARVRAAFADERDRAEADLRSDPLVKRPRHRLPRLLVAAGAIGIIAVVAVSGTLFVSYVRTPAASPSPSRYPDGIPTTWQGQPVLRWADALARRETVKDDESFLVGAWIEILDGWNCPAVGPDPWDPGECQKSIAADAGGSGYEPNTVSFHFGQGTLVRGPAILRVHLHDPRSNQCVGQEAICDSMIVIDRALWTGDSYTSPQPFSVADVIAAASAASPGVPLEATSTPNYDTDFAGAAKLSQPRNAYIADYSSQIVSAFVAPSAAAVTRRLPDVQPGAAGALLQSAVSGGPGCSPPDYSRCFDDRWLVVDNVAFLVETASPPSAADEAWLRRLEAALKATH
jgi:hypothetical protein